MAVGAQEPLRYLLDRVPTWLTTLQTVAAGTDARLLEPTFPEDHQPPPLTDGSSHTAVSEEHNPARTESHPPTQLPALIPIKKRKRDDESGGSRRKKYRARNATVVYFDGHAQKQLESIVEEVAKALGLIRQARLARTRSPTKSPLMVAQELSTLASDTELDDEILTLEEAVLERLRTRRFGTPEEVSRLNKQNRKRELAVTPQAVHVLEDDKTLDLTARALEQASDLCEVAAYQLLRDGDCRLEASAATRKFEEMYGPLVKEAAALQESQKHARPTLDENVNSTKPTDSLTTSLKDLGSGSMGADQITLGCDDDDDDDEDRILLSPIRLTSRRVC